MPETRQAPVRYRTRAHVFTSDESLASLQLYAKPKTSQNKTRQPIISTSSDNNVSLSCATSVCPIKKEVYVKELSSLHSLSQVKSLSEFNSKNIEACLLDNAVKAFHPGFSLSAMVSRDKELESILHTIRRGLETNDRSTALYICGAPGTGKTSSVLRAIDIIEKNSVLKKKLHRKWSLKHCILNAAMMSSTVDFLRHCMKQLDISIEKEALLIEEYHEIGLGAILEKIVTRDRAFRQNSVTNKKIIYIIDEADQLNNLSFKKGYSSHTRYSSLLPSRTFLEELVYAALKPSSRIVLMIISNCLSFGSMLSAAISKRFEESSVSCNPTQKHHKELSIGLELLIFGVYTDDDLRHIVNKRLEIAQQTTIQMIKDHFNLKINDMSYYKNLVEKMNPFDSMSLTLILKRIAIHQGDCRQMLDACRQLLQHQLNKLSNDDAKCDLTICSLNKRLNNNEDTYNHMAHTTHFKLKNLCIESPEKKQRFNPLSSSDLSESFHCLKDNISDGSTAPSSPRTHFDQDVQLLDTDMITVEDTKKVLDKHFQKPRAKCLDIISRLPLHQQILLCAVCIAAQHESVSLNIDSYIPMDSIQSVYISLCETHGISIEYKQCDFLDGLLTLQQTGLLDIKRGESKQSGLITTHKLELLQQRRQQSRQRLYKHVSRGVKNSMSNTMSHSIITVQIRFSGTDVCDVLGELKSVFKKLLQEEIAVI